MNPSKPRLAGRTGNRRQTLKSRQADRARLHACCNFAAIPPSYWDWRIWTKAWPTPRRFGDAANRHHERETLLTLDEWMRCLLVCASSVSRRVRRGDLGYAEVRWAELD